MKKIIISLSLLLLSNYITPSHHKLFKEYDTLPRPIDEVYNNTNLFYKAVIDGDIDKVQRLINKEININARNLLGYTPLHCAAKKGHKFIAKLLIIYGANIWAEDNAKKTPIDLAIANNHKDIVKLFDNEIKEEIKANL